MGGLAADAGQGLGDADVVGRHWAAGGAVQVADCRPAQLDRLRREFSPTLAGEEGGNVLAGGRQRRQVVACAPGAHGGAGGPAGVI